MKKSVYTFAIKALLIADALIILAGAMLGPIYALFVEEIGGDLLDASIAAGLYAMAAGLTALYSGKLSDQIKRSELIVVAGYALMGIGFFLFTIVHSIWFLFVIQLLIGFGEAIYSPAYDALFSENLRKKTFGRGWGAWTAMYYFTTALGAIIGGLIATYLGFNTLFIVMAIIAFSSAIFIYALPKKSL